MFAKISRNVSKECQNAVMGLPALPLRIHRRHFRLEHRHLVLSYLRLVAIFLIVLKQHGEHVGDGLALRVSHGIDSGKYALGHELVFQLVAPAVTSDDTTHFPEPQVVEELTARDTNLANDQLIDVVGGYAFFRFLAAFPSGLSSGSPVGTA